MSFNPDFLDMISRQGSKAPRYSLESILGGAVPSFGGLLRLTSHYEGWGSQQAIARTGHSFSAARLQPGEWSSSYGTLRIALTGGYDIRNLPGYAAARGQPVHFRVGFKGWSFADYQPVFSGHIQEISRSNGQWFIVVKSGVASLVNRFTESTGQTALFWDFPQADVTVGPAAYVAGAANIQVSSTANPEKELVGVGTQYVLEVTATTGDLFWVTATGKAAAPTRFTGLTGATFLNTTPQDAAVGNVVTPYYHLAGHPVDVARKVIASTGLGTNGFYDTMPSSWGIGLADSFLDHDDMDQTIVLASPNAGLQYWNIIGNQPENDAMGWLQSWLNVGGYFITDYQGQISVRAGLNSLNWHTDLEVVHDGDIIEISGYESWDSSSNVEYDSVALKGPGFSLTTGEALTSRPIVAARERSLDFIDQNTLNWTQEISARIGPWDMRVPESVDILCAGWRLAKLGPGSHIVISSRYFTTRSLLLNQVFLVTSVTPDWFGGTVRLTASHVPENSDDL